MASWSFQDSLKMGFGVRTTYSQVETSYYHFKRSPSIEYHYIQFCMSYLESRNAFVDEQQTLKTVFFVNFLRLKY